VTDGSGRRGGCADPDLHPLPFRQHPQFARTQIHVQSHRRAHPASESIPLAKPRNHRGRQWKSRIRVHLQRRLVSPQLAQHGQPSADFLGRRQVKRAAGARKAAGLVVGLMIAASAMKRLDHSSDVTVF
jgi:hypothetical protein